MNRLLGALLVVALLAGCGPAARVSPVTSSSSAYRGIELSQPYTLPQVTLTDQDARPFDLRTGSPKPVLILFFGYSHCPDICKTTLSDLASALNRVDPATRAKIQVILVTVDPERDTPAVLKAYLNRFDPSFIGLTGDRALIESAGAALGVVVEGTTPAAGGGYDVIHSTQVIAVDAARQGRIVWTQGTPIGSFVDDFETFTARA